MRTALILLPAWSIQNLPLGLATVATQFRNCGYPVEVFDLNVSCWHQCRRRYGNTWKYGHPLYWDDQSRSKSWERDENDKIESLTPEMTSLIDRVMARVLGKSFDLFAFSVFEGNILSTLYAIQCIRNRFPDVRMLFGGPSAEDIFLNSNKDTNSGHWPTEMDYVIPGEAENVLSEFCQWLKNEIGEPPDGVITFRNSSVKYSTSVSTKTWETLEIDYSGYDLTYYSQRVIPVEITRGCTRKCAYCSEKKLYAGYRVKSIDCLIRMFQTCTKKWKCRWFSFTGSNINGDFSFFVEMLNRIQSSGISMGWGGSIILNKQLDTQTIRAMARSGCTYINTGIESASPAVLEKINKPIDLEHAERILHDLHIARINAAVNFIAGLPGESEADHQLTLDFIRKNGKYIKRVHVSPCRIFKNTALSLNPRQFNIKFLSGCGPDEWVTENGDNTIAIRQRRVSQIISIAVECGIQWLAPFENDISLRRNF